MEWIRRHAGKLALTGLAGLLLITVWVGGRLIPRIPNASDAQAAQRALEALRVARPELEDKTCYYKPIAGRRAILLVYGVTESVQIDEIERSARQVVPRFVDRALLRFYSAEVIHELPNGAAARGKEELLREVVID